MRAAAERSRSRSRVSTILRPIARERERDPLSSANTSLRRRYGSSASEVLQIALNLQHLARSHSRLAFTVLHILTGRLIPSPIHLSPLALALVSSRRLLFVQSPRTYFDRTVWDGMGRLTRSPGGRWALVAFESTGAPPRRRGGSCVGVGVVVVVVKPLQRRLTIITRRREFYYLERREE